MRTVLALLVLATVLAPGHAAPSPIWKKVKKGVKKVIKDIKEENCKAALGKLSKYIST